MRLTIRLYWDFIGIELVDHGMAGTMGTTVRWGPQRGRDHGKVGTTARRGNEMGVKQSNYFWYIYINM